MPCTPYHFGPSGFVALILRKYIDVPVFILANVIVDIEVLLYDHWPIHRYVHTLLIGALAGILWGLAAYPFRNLFKKIMQVFHVPYKTGFWKMLISGVLGVWFHVLIDAVYHWDVNIFWPSKVKPLYNLLTKQQVKIMCLTFFIWAFISYIFAVKSYLQQKNKSKLKPFDFAQDRPEAK